MGMQGQIMPGRDYLDNPNTSALMLMGRLKPGVSVAQAKEDVNLAFKRALEGNYGARLTVDDRTALQKPSNANIIEVTPGGKGFSRLRHSFSQPLVLLMAVVGLVLVIACVNVANLLLARASSRNKEIAVRLAIGAKPYRLIRQLLTESVLLALLGGALGLVFAVWGANLLVRLTFGQGALRALNIHPDPRMLAFTAGICVLTGILFGLAPALRALGVPLASTLKDGARGSSGASGRWTIGKFLVAGQVALSLLVLFASGLFVRTLRNLRDVDFGYQRENLLIVRPDLISAGYKHDQLPALSTQLIERLSTLPGVTGATVSENGLFSGTESADDIKVEGYTPKNDQDAVAYDDWVGADYFKIVGIPILVGRGIGSQDTASSPRVAVINEAMAKFYFPGANPIGRKFVIDDPAQRDRVIEVVGVCKDFRDHSLRKSVDRRFFLAYSQSMLGDLEAYFIMRYSGDSGTLVNAVRGVFRQFNPNVYLSDIGTLSANVDQELEEETLVAELSTFFAGLALLLACIGLYGVMSFAVSGRTREIGVRMALGAQRKDVLWMVLREALILVLIGVCVGIPAAFGSSRLLTSMLYALSGLDPVSMAVSVALLLSVAAFASYVPARRATLVDPLVALRYE
jgi:predicted permease